MVSIVTFSDPGSKDVTVRVPNATLREVTQRPEAAWNSDIVLRHEDSSTEVAWRTVGCSQWHHGSFLESFRTLTQYKWNSGPGRRYVRLRGGQDGQLGLRDLLDDGEFRSIEELATHYRSRVMDPDQLLDVYTGTRVDRG